MRLEPSIDDRLGWTSSRLSIGVALDHGEATLVELSHVVVALFRIVRVARQTRLQRTRCRTVLILF